MHMNGHFAITKIFLVPTLALVVSLGALQGLVDMRSLSHHGATMGEPAAEQEQVPKQVSVDSIS
jgi:hypothetical protein